ncbi:MAG: diphosphomevalonate decarboxylase [Pontiella sp.]
MHDIQHQFVKNILFGAETNLKEQGSAFAPSNIALSKYWGKRDPALNLPINSSLSVSLGKLGTKTELRIHDEDVASTKDVDFVEATTPSLSSRKDLIYLNGALQAPDSSFAQRISEFLDLFRPMVGNAAFEVRTENNIPTAAGLASSASGFAALIMALDDLAGWGLDKKKLSMLARLGSGSASRSVYDGFVQWHAGSNSDGTDSFSEKLPNEWPEFRIGILELCAAKKPVGSRDGMNRTVETSELYKSWPEQANADIDIIRRAIEVQDFTVLGQTAERNALSMHATMMSAWPPLIYLQPETIEQIHKVHRVRAEGLEVYLTIDAGPNIKLLFLEENEAEVLNAFSDLKIINPFGISDA